MEALASIVAAERVCELVVGLPLSVSGAENEWSREVRHWALGIGLALGLPVVLRDERLTSWEAERGLHLPRPRTARMREAVRGRIDREAAAIILTDEMRSRDRQERSTSELS